MQREKGHGLMKPVSLEREFSKEVLRRDMILTLKALRQFSLTEFQATVRYFMSMMHQNEAEREERLDSLLYLRMLSEKDFNRLLENMEQINSPD